MAKKDSTNPDLPPWITNPAGGPYIGETRFHLGNAEQAWTILEFRSPNDKSWAFCERGGAKQWFPMACMATVPTYKPEPEQTRPAERITPQEAKARTKPPKAERPKIDRPRDVGDLAAQAMASGLDPWIVYELAAKMDPTLDPAATRGKIGHLSNGLQRMGLGNRLRNAINHGRVDGRALMTKIEEMKK